jgi:conjugative relaxase-like TrwC/TraI family protein
VLSIGKLALGQQRYYEQQVAHGGDDYYSGRGESPGEWTGAGAGELGLAGEVTAAQFNALLAGADPRDPEVPLRAGNSAPEIAALDLTFSAPKSVSVLFAVAPAETSAALVEAHQQAVRAALGYLEETAVFVRRGKAGHRFEHAGGLIAAAYRHRMSRSLDPQLHTHVVAANLARGEDGRYTALHHPSLYRAAQTAGYLYQAHLRAEVRDRLGVEWGPVVKGAAELRALSGGVLRTFSQRRAQVEAVIAEREAELGRPLTKAERSTWGAIATRDRKQYGIETHTWRQEITARAAEHGLDRELVGELLESGRERVRHGRLAGEGELQRGGERVGEGELGASLAGPVGLTERQNTFDEPAVLREFAAAAAQGARVETTRGQAERFACREDVLRTQRGTLTGSDLVECERALIAAAVERADEGTAQLEEHAVEDALAAGERPLTPEQAAAVKAVTTSGNGVDVIEALAGTGKTYTAGALHEVCERADYSVLGVAPSARAARELQEQAGIPARTLDSLLLAIEGGWQIPTRSVLVIDEAGMASTRQTATLLEHAAARRAKVIAIGDSGQLPSVLAGGWLAGVGQRLGAVRLTEVMRQRDTAERRALGALHDGIPERWIAWARQAGRVEVLSEGQQALEHAIAEWAHAVGEQGLAQAVLIARENETRRALNELAREHQRQAGALGEEHGYGAVTVAVGDRVICRHNDYDLDVDNGLRGTIRDVRRDGIVIESDARLIRELPAGYVAEHVEHAYALTGHGMQGATVEHAIVLAHPHDLSRGWSYTALSRARGTTRLLIAADLADRAGREEIAPHERSRGADRTNALAQVARRMLERDDEDLAIDQLPAAGRADDPRLAPARGVHPPHQQAAQLAEPGSPHAAPLRLGQLREQIQGLRAQLAALPTGELSQIDQLDARARELTERRDRLGSQLEGLPQPRRRLLGRGGDPHLLERTRVASALAGAEEQLERALSDRSRFVREVGQPDQARTKRDGLRSAIERLDQQRIQLLDELVEREIQRQPEWLARALGERPDRAWEADRWDRNALAIARYRVQYDVVGDRDDLLGPQPDQPGDQLHDYQGARQTAAREREAPCHDLGIG